MRNIGSMRWTGTLKSNVQGAKDAGGGRSDSYNPIYTCRGELKRRFGHEENDAYMVQLRTTYDWTVRWHPTIEVDKKSVWAIEDKTYTIEDWEEDGMYYRFTLTEKGA